MKRALSIILALICLLAVAVPAMAASSFEDVSKSVVRIYVEYFGTLYDAKDESVVYEENIPATFYSTGSGFAVGKKGEPVKYFVTNHHVVEEQYEEKQVTVEDSNGSIQLRQAIIRYDPKVYILFTDVENKVVANITAVSDRCDLAVISLNNTTTERVPVTIKTFNDLGYISVTAFGFPGVGDAFNNLSTVGESDLNSYSSDIIVTSGNVSSVKEHAVTKLGELILHTAKISAGNSGGPLVDDGGKVLGVNTYSINEDEQVKSSDYSASVSSNELVSFLDANKIPYATPGFELSLTLIIVIAAAVVVILAIVIILVSKKGGAKKGGRSLYCDEGSLKGRKYVIKNKLTIGHDAQRCQVVFPANAPGISGLHCTIHFDGKQVTVVDENSRYGTWIDNQRLQPGVATVMHRGQKLYLGSTKQALSLHN